MLAELIAEVSGKVPGSGAADAARCHHVQVDLAHLEPFIALGRTDGVLRQDIAEHLDIDEVCRVIRRLEVLIFKDKRCRRPCRRQPGANGIECGRVRHDQSALMMIAG